MKEKEYKMKALYVTGKGNVVFSKRKNKEPIPAGKFENPDKLVEDGFIEEVKTEGLEASNEEKPAPKKRGRKPKSSE